MRSVSPFGLKTQSPSATSPTRFLNGRQTSREGFRGVNSPDPQHFSLTQRLSVEELTRTSMNFKRPIDHNDTSLTTAMQLQTRRFIKAVDHLKHLICALIDNHQINRAIIGLDSERTALELTLDQLVRSPRNFQATVSVFQGDSSSITNIRRENERLKSQLDGLNFDLHRISQLSSGTQHSHSPQSRAGSGQCIENISRKISLIERDMKERQGEVERLKQLAANRSASDQPSQYLPKAVSQLVSNLKGNTSKQMSDYFDLWKKMGRLEVLRTEASQNNDIDKKIKLKEMISFLNEETQEILDSLAGDFSRQAASFVRQKQQIGNGSQFRRSSQDELVPLHSVNRGLTVSTTNEWRSSEVRTQSEAHQHSQQKLFSQTHSAGRVSSQLDSQKYLPQQIIHVSQMKSTDQQDQLQQYQQVDKVRGEYLRHFIEMLRELGVSVSKNDEEHKIIRILRKEFSAFAYKQVAQSTLVTELQDLTERLQDVIKHQKAEERQQSSSIHSLSAQTTSDHSKQSPHQLHAIQGKVVSLREYMSDNRQESEDLRRHIMSLQTKLQEKDKELISLKEQIESSTVELSYQLGSLRSILKTANLESTGSSCDLLERVYSHLAHLSAEEQRKHQQRNVIEDLEFNAIDSSSKLQQIVSENHELAKTNEHLRARIDQLKRDFTESEAKANLHAKKLLSQFNERARECSRLATEKAHLQEESEQKIQELLRMSREVAQQTSLVSQQTVLVKNLQQDLEKKSKVISSLEEKLLKQQSLQEGEILSSQQAKYDKVIGVLQSELNENKADIERMKMKLEEKKTQEKIRKTKNTEQFKSVQRQHQQLLSQFDEASAAHQQESIILIEQLKAAKTEIQRKNGEIRLLRESEVWHEFARQGKTENRRGKSVLDGNSQADLSESSKKKMLRISDIEKQAIQESLDEFTRQLRAKPTLSPSISEAKRIHKADETQSVLLNEDGMRLTTESIGGSRMFEVAKLETRFTQEKERQAIDFEGKLASEIAKVKDVHEQVLQEVYERFEDERMSALRQFEQHAIQSAQLESQVASIIEQNNVERKVIQSEFDERLRIQKQFCENEVCREVQILRESCQSTERRMAQVEEEAKGETDKLLHRISLLEEVVEEQEEEIQKLRQKPDQVELEQQKETIIGRGWQQQLQQQGKKREEKEYQAFNTKEGEDELCLQIDDDDSLVSKQKKSPQKFSEMEVQQAKEERESLKENFIELERLQFRVVEKDEINKQLNELVVDMKNQYEVLSEEIHRQNEYIRDLKESARLQQEQFRLASRETEKILKLENKLADEKAQFESEIIIKNEQNIRIGEQLIKEKKLHDMAIKQFQDVKRQLEEANVHFEIIRSGVEEKNQLQLKLVEAEKQKEEAFRIQESAMAEREQLKNNTEEKQKTIQQLIQKVKEQEKIILELKEEADIILTKLKKQFKENESEVEESKSNATEAIARLYLFAAKLEEAVKYLVVRQSKISNGVLVLPQISKEEAVQLGKDLAQKLALLLEACSYTDEAIIMVEQGGDSSFVSNSEQFIKDMEGVGRSTAINHQEDNNGRSHMSDVNQSLSDNINQLMKENSQLRASKDHYESKHEEQSQVLKLKEGVIGQLDGQVDQLKKETKKLREQTEAVTHRDHLKVIFIQFLCALPEKKKQLEVENFLNILLSMMGVTEREKEELILGKLAIKQADKKKSISELLIRK